MDPLPPRLVRRLVLAPLVLVLSLVLLALCPVFLLAAAIADLFMKGSWRTVRMVAFITAYLALEVAGLVIMFVLWIASGFGARIHTARMQRSHYGFMRWWLLSTDKAVRKLFRLRIYIEERPVPRAGPICVFSRHAGPGNSLFLVGTLLVGYHRQPRIVMLAKLQWEPLYDTM